jgi:hypothetical protein
MSVSQPPPPSQSAVPGAQVDPPQTPLAQPRSPPHSYAIGHALPHAPQCSRLVKRSVSQPFVGLPSQSPQPGSQEGTHWFGSQKKPEQTDVPCGLVQTTPQPPQLLGSVDRSVSQPFVELLSQSASGGWHG